MHRFTPILLPFVTGCLMLPAAFAMSPPAAQGQAPRARASTASSSSQPHVCLADVFYGPLPGKADYCLGMQDWKASHYSSGLELLKLAAGWGNKNAQYTLGLIYYGGRHVPKNVPLGMAWLKLADERSNDPDIERARRSAFKWATAEQRRTAEQLFGQMRGKFGDKVAAARAWHHLRHWQKRHTRRNSGCIRVFGAEAAAVRRMGIAGMPTRTIGMMVNIPADGTKGKSGGLWTREDRSNQRAGVCVNLHMRHHVTHVVANKYFKGWMGTVTVGPLKAVPAHATSADR